MRTSRLHRWGRKRKEGKEGGDSDLLKFACALYTEMERVCFITSGFAASHWTGCRTPTCWSQTPPLLRLLSQGHTPEPPHTRRRPHSQREWLPPIKSESPLASGLPGSPCWALANHLLLPALPRPPHWALQGAALGEALGEDVNDAETPRWETPTPAEKWHTPSRGHHHFLRSNFLVSHYTKLV